MRNLSPDLLDRIREALAVAEARSSLRQLAAQLGMSPTGLRKFIRGTEPHRRTCEKAQAWYIRHVQQEGHPVDALTAAAAASLLAGAIPTLGAQLLVMVAEAHRQAGLQPPEWVDAGIAETPASAN